MPVIFQRINEDHALQAAAIIVKAYIEPPWNEAWTLERAAARMGELSTTPGWLGVGALESGTLRGFAIGLPHTSAAGRGLYIPEIAVLPSHQRRGIGKQLLGFLEAEALSSGFSSAWLLSQNEGATAEYYKASGYNQATMLRIYSKPLSGALSQCSDDL
ncbi:GNAT family N-acetyltransferase [Ensifer sp. 4252]|uniref:GNAT family N-acetyltransferase n=1 Tax=Ensifer sp. 4252 TaxID=3373915 RepID=UPI003D1FD7E5